jgi:hypothetical protein
MIKHLLLFGIIYKYLPSALFFLPFSVSDARQIAPCQAAAAAFVMPHRLPA